MDSGLRVRMSEQKRQTAHLIWVHRAHRGVSLSFFRLTSEAGIKMIYTKIMRWRCLIESFTVTVGSFFCVCCNVEQLYMYVVRLASHGRSESCNQIHSQK